MIAGAISASALAAWGLAETLALKIRVSGRANINDEVGFGMGRGSLRMTCVSVEGIALRVKGRPELHKPKGNAGRGSEDGAQPLPLMRL